ncbi:hypothetical protein AUJ14_00975 [Candidatus Micrarchaeota archaeon CG1_02_55_22]|nr:MAG: hypothetical protein AUJ14_00975 [Candidatus Micrarchaeota archaeon CG1_02_55_22]
MVRITGDWRCLTEFGGCGKYYDCNRKTCPNCGKDTVGAYAARNARRIIEAWPSASPSAAALVRPASKQGQPDNAGNREIGGI